MWNGWWDLLSIHLYWQGLRICWIVISGNRSVNIFQTKDVLNSSTNENSICRYISIFLPNSVLQAFPQSPHHILGLVTVLLCLIVLRGRQHSATLRAPPGLTWIPASTGERCHGKKRGGRCVRDGCTDAPFTQALLCQRWCTLIRAQIHATATAHHIRVMLLNMRLNPSSGLAPQTAR